MFGGRNKGVENTIGKILYLTAWHPLPPQQYKNRIFLRLQTLLLPKLMHHVKFAFSKRENRPHGQCEGL